MSEPTAVRFMASVQLHLRGTHPPSIEVGMREEDGEVTLLFRGNNINQIMAFVGTAQEVRAALEKGLAAVDRAEADRGPRAVPKIPDPRRKVPR